MWGLGDELRWVRARGRVRQEEVDQPSGLLRAQRLTFAQSRGERIGLLRCTQARAEEVDLRPRVLAVFDASDDLVEKRARVRSVGLGQRDPLADIVAAGVADRVPEAVGEVVGVPGLVELPERVVGLAAQHRGVRGEAVLAGGGVELAGARRGSERGGGVATSGVVARDVVPRLAKRRVDGRDALEPRERFVGAACARADVAECGHRVGVARIEGERFAQRWLEERVIEARVVAEDEVSTDVVSIGSTVRLKDVEGKSTVEYHIVGSAEANPEERKLSNESPVGRAIMGRKKGETVEVTVPRGTMKFKILEIKLA